MNSLVILNRSYAMEIFKVFLYQEDCVQLIIEAINCEDRLITQSSEINAT